MRRTGQHDRQPSTPVKSTSTSNSRHIRGNQKTTGEAVLAAAEDKKDSEVSTDSLESKRKKPSPPGTDRNRRRTKSKGTKQLERHWSSRSVSSLFVNSFSI
jgi:hypothetical protein